MALYNRSPEELLAAAELGNKLKPRERQDVVTWLESSGEIANYSDHKLAGILGSRLAAIDRYKKIARRTLANAISTDEAMDYMARFVRTYDLLSQQARIGMKASALGTQAHQGYIRLLKEIEAEKVEKLQSIGVIPKELGRLTTITEEWTAEVSKDGVASVRDTSGDANGSE